MKKTIAVLFAFVTIGSAFAQQLGTPTPLQRVLNELPAIPIAGRNLKFQFGGTAWIATVNGENALAGTVETVDINGGSILTLKQTHVWAAAAGRAVGGLLGGALGGAVGNLASTWVATPGPEIVLDYNGATLSMASEARVAEARAAGVSTAGATIATGMPPAATGANIAASSSATAAAPPLIPVASTGFANPNISGYFVVVNGMQTGPYDESGLRALISQKQLTKNSLVWKEGMSSWIVAGAVDELAPLFTYSKVQTARNTYGNDGEPKFAMGLQAGSRFGLSFVGDNEDHFSSTYNYTTGFYTSLYGMYAFSSFFSLQSGLAFSFNDGYRFLKTVDDYDYYRHEDYIFKFNVLDISVLPTFTLHPLQNLLVRFSIGPLISVALSNIEEDWEVYGSEKYIGNYDGAGSDTWHFNNRFSLGFLLGVGIGYSIGKGNIIFDIRGFANLRSWTYDRHFNSWFEDNYVRHGAPLLLLGYEYWF